MCLYTCKRVHNTMFELHRLEYDEFAYVLSIMASPTFWEVTYIKDQYTFLLNLYTHIQCIYTLLLLIWLITSTVSHHDTYYYVINNHSHIVQRMFSRVSYYRYHLTFICMGWYNLKPYNRYLFLLVMMYVIFRILESIALPCHYNYKW